MEKNPDQNKDKILEKRAELLKSEIKAKETELSDLQNQCKHLNKEIKMDDKNIAMWECIDCGKRLKYPSQNELKKWIERLRN